MKAGIGKADITPDTGAFTSLYIGYRITEIVTPLRLKVCLLQDERGQKAAVVSVETMCLYERAIDDIRSRISEAAGLAKTRIFLNATHTHSSPYLNRSVQEYLQPFGMRFLDADYYAKVLSAAERAAKEALSGLTDVRIKRSSAPVSGVACNRRVKLSDGSIGTRYGRGVSEELRGLPDGLIDPNVHCVWFVDDREQVVGSLLHYACHATSYNQYDHISWDYPGYAAADVERELGGTCLFLQGCAGNISPGKYTVGDPLDDCMRLGRHVSEAAVSSYADARYARGDELLVECGKLPAELRILHSKEALENMLGEEIAKFRKERELHPQRYGGADIVSLAARIGLVERYPDLRMPAEAAVMKVADVLLVFLPGEMFIESAIALKKRFPEADALVMAYGDASLEYIPPREAFNEKGGYETCEEWCFSAPGNAEALESLAGGMMQKIIGG